MKLIKNKSIDQLRSKKNRLGVWSEELDYTDTAANPYQQTEQQDTFRQIRKMMQQLPEKQRMTMHLRDIEGMTYQEISQIMDIPLNQVKVNLFRARKHMRQLLTNQQTYGL